jgi:pimeloyl-ACP methyl ester carboxylesterase
MSAVNPPAPDRPQSPAGVRSTFVSGGIRCAATLRLPPDAGGEPSPAILMVHGWGGVQNLFTPPFCDAFTEAGFAVMTFDYAGWGESEGEPRNVIAIRSRLRNAEDALAHLKRVPQIDSRRVFLWGVSLGGGHVIDLAARHPELAGAIAQAPVLDGLAAMTQTSLLRALRMAACVLADLVYWNGPVYAPVISPPGGLGTIDSDGAYDRLMDFQRKSGQQYSNRVSASSVLTLARYQPRKRLKDIRIPALLIGASRDGVAPFDEEAVRRADNPLLKIRLIDGNHFDPYVEPVFSVNIACQLEFLKDTLAARAGAG